LARALAWRFGHREAELELGILSRQRPNDAEIVKLEELVRPNLEPSSFEARQWVAQRPYYQPYRAAFAQALVREHQPRLAIAVYDTLLAANPSASLLRELGNAYSAAGDRAAASRV
jgi:predicted Zn-dependent protease